MSNLRDRLKRIQEVKKKEPEKDRTNFDTSVLAKKGWEACGYQVLKREAAVKAPFNIKARLPKALSIVIPDLTRTGIPKAEDFLFFDLETTGLSGGAGTVAFLAAFGRFSSGGKLVITQYLLLDYPGENDFLEAVLKEFSNKNSVIVSYNGKCFDSQILKTRCLMNGIKPPLYNHVDLLHPARRLWKNIIFDCSQGSIETNILNLDRKDDIPGSLAPEIWFEFLKTGKTERLLGICKHNVSDISGLASILAAMICIASDPFTAMNNYRYDFCRLALYWRDFCCKNKRYLLPENKEFLVTGNKLLKHITESDFPDDKKEAALRFLLIYKNRWLKSINRSAL